MAHPISGPFVETRVVRGTWMNGPYPIATDVSRTVISRFKQAKPYDIPLPFGYDRMWAGWSSGTHTNGASDLMGSISGSSTEQWRAQGQAYSRFKDQVQTQAQLLVLLAQRQESMDMIANRLGKLWLATRAIRKGKFTDAWRHLNPASAPAKGWRPKSKAFGSAWLEYSFGWKPLVQDIQSALEILDKPFPQGKVKSSASWRWNSQYTAMNVNSFWYRHRWIQTTSVEGKIKYGATIRVTNPNLYTAASMGLINPGTLVWELIPFSFVVDWFTGIGAYLESFTDFCGLSLENTWTTQLYDITNTDVSSWTQRDVDGLTGVVTTTNGGHSKFYRHFKVLRTRNPPQMPTPRLTVPRLSLSRALNASSLLLIQLKG